MPMTATGEVRICWREDQYGKAYLIAMGRNNNDAEPREPARWAAEQVDGHEMTDRVEDEDFSWVQELIDKWIVPSPHCPVSWAAARGSFGPIEDGLAVCMVADVHPTLEDENFYISSFPMSSWDERTRAIELGLRAMAVQRYCREQLVGDAARAQAPGFKPIPMPLPGLRLRQPMPPMSREEWGEEPGFDWEAPEYAEARRYQATMDFCSAIGGIEHEVLPADV